MFWNVVWGAVIILLLASGLFDVIEWRIGIWLIGAVVIIWFISIYNGFAQLVNRAEEAWADIDVQLRRRYDLITNLVETVKGYAAHEREAFQKVTEARTKALNAQTVHDKEEADTMLTSALKSIFAISEAYPQLRAVESFVKLQEELSDTENKIQAARRFYNTTARDLNTMIDMFPYALLAAVGGFKKREFFELDLDQDGAVREPVSVKF